MDFAEIEVGAVLTDSRGNGSFGVVIGPVPSGAYELEFFVRDSGTVRTVPSTAIHVASSP